MRIIVTLIALTVMNLFYVSVTTPKPGPCWTPPGVQQGSECE